MGNKNAQIFHFIGNFVRKFKEAFYSSISVISYVIRICHISNFIRHRSVLKQLMFYTQRNIFKSVKKTERKHSELFHSSRDVDGKMIYNIHSMPMCNML